MKEKLVIVPPHLKVVKEEKIAKRDKLYFLVIGMIFSSLVQILSSAIKFLNVWLKIDSLSLIAKDLSIWHYLSGVVLGILVLTHLVLHRKWIIRMTKKLIKAPKWNKKTYGYLINMGMLISGFFVFITGLIKFPSILASSEFLFAVSVDLLIIHDWSGIIVQVFVLLHIFSHWKWIVARSNKLYRRTSLKKVLRSVALPILVISFILPLNIFLINAQEDALKTSGQYREKIQIAGVGWPEYDSNEITSVRPDLFKEGHFSIFDILVYLDNKNVIDMIYHFDYEMDTHVIDSINDERGLWYNAYYDGGWDEENVFRMDHYPYKPEIDIKIVRAKVGQLASIYSTFREEIARLNSNNGSIIIPNVIIKSPHNNLNFQNIKVTAHNLRNDTFQEGVITAIDVIMSLGDQGLITYELKWYETIGRAKVKNYYVDGINSNLAYARCGFVYETGDLDFYAFRGNHIHIPSDYRIITSPEYEEWFWICI